MITKRLIRLMVFSFGVIALSSGCAFTRDLFKRTPLEPSEVFDRTSSLIEKNYIDKSGNGIKLDRSMRPDVMSLVAQLDPSTVFHDPEESAFMTTGVAAATGIRMSLKGTSGEIEGTLVGSPARRAGLRRGDKIVEINDHAAAGLKGLIVLKMLRGAPGSEVKLKIAKQSGEERTLTLTREHLKLSQTIFHKIDEDNVGYLRIESFWPDTPAAVKEAVERSRKEKVKGLILDIRNNSGGLFPAITDAAQLFLKDDGVICTIRKKGGKEQDYVAGGRNHYTDLPVVVLIDGKTASGAEILAAALRDNKRALLVGERSAGMVEIQTLFPLGDGSHIKFRTALAYRPTGAIYDEQGIAANREIILTEEERAGIYTQIETSVDGYIGNEAQDRQVKAAIGILSGSDGSK